MPAVSACPKCGQYVTIPNDVLPAEQVRCPHCAAAFPLEDASGDPPPALIRVAAPDEEAAELIVGETDDEAADLVVDEEIPALGAVGDEADEGPWAKATADHEPSDAEAVLDEPSLYDIRPPDGESADEQADEHADAAEEPAIAAVYAEAFDFTPRDRNEDDSTAALAARLRQNAEKHSMFGELVKIVLGGVVGLAIGYYLLNFFGGQQFDRLPLYLPGCPHTYHHWPGGENGDKSNYEPPLSVLRLLQ